MRHDTAHGNIAPQPPFRSRLAETVVLVALAIAFSFVLRATAVQAYEVPTPSMEPTIMTNDRVVAEMVSLHFRTPQQGDLVVFTDPEGSPVPLLKRVIAVGGQTVDVRGGSVWVDNVRLVEPYTHGLSSEPFAVALPLTVPAGHVWVMGDNRSDSKDSRVFGSISSGSIRARVLCVYWPLDDAGSLLDAE